MIKGSLFQKRLRAVFSKQIRDSSFSSVKYKAKPNKWGSSALPYLYIVQALYERVHVGVYMSRLTLNMTLLKVHIHCNNCRKQSFSNRPNPISKALSLLPVGICTFVKYSLAL